MWDIVRGATPTPPANHADLAQWIKSDKRAQNFILSALDKTMIHHTNTTPTSAEVWQRLQDLYQATDSSHKMLVTKQFHSLSMKDGEQVEKYVQQFRSLRARLASCGTVLTETKAAEAFLASLPASYSAFVTAQSGLLD